MVNVKLFVVNENETNSILIWDETNQGLLIDPGFCSKEEFYIFSDFVHIYFKHSSDTWPL